MQRFPDRCIDILITFIGRLGFDSLYYSYSNEESYAKNVTVDVQDKNNKVESWRCAKCSKLITALPCPYCGNDV